METLTPGLCTYLFIIFKLEIPFCLGGAVRRSGPASGERRPRPFCSPVCLRLLGVAGAGGRLVVVADAHLVRRTAHHQTRVLGGVRSYERETQHTGHTSRRDYGLTAEGHGL